MLSACNNPWHLVNPQEMFVFVILTIIMSSKAE